MKLLVLAARIPAPNKKGDQVIAYRRLIYLASRGHSLHLVCFGDVRKADDFQAYEDLRSHGISIDLIKWSMWEAIFNLTLAIFRPALPFQCAMYNSANFFRAVKKENPDVIYCIMVRVIENIKKFKGRLFVEMIDSMGLNFSRRASMHKYLRRWIIKIEALRVQRYEKLVADRSNYSFVVSTIDKVTIGSSKVEVIPLGVDPVSYHAVLHDKSKPIIIFTGNMSYQPNIDAICWFVSNCWQEIKRNVAHVSLIVAGSNPNERVVELGRNDCSIKITGAVNSMSDVIKSATIAIAPMRSGSGMQFKILEAMACGIPVVSTALGLGDIQAEPDIEIVLADTPAQFVDCVLTLLRDQILRKSVGDAGFKYVYENHLWDTLNMKFEAFLTSKLG